MPRMTAAQVTAALRERDVLARRIRRLNHFIDTGAASSPTCQAIMVEARDVLADEKLMLELRLSLALPKHALQVVQ